MTDFKRQLLKLGKDKYRAGSWRFTKGLDGNWHVRYRGWRLGNAYTLADAIGWAKVHWRKTEKDIDLEEEKNETAAASKSAR